MKTYVGLRRPEPEVLVETPSGTYPLVHIVHHSPTGFEWGYGGSGPADLARSILADAAGMDVADALYQDFKWDVVARLPRDGWRMSEVAVREWLQGKIAARDGTVERVSSR